MPSPPFRSPRARRHRATVHLYELLNVHVRASPERDGTCSREVFDANALVKAFQDVTSLHGDACAPASFLADAFAHVPDFERVPRQGLVQVLTYTGLRTSMERPHEVVHRL